MLFEYLYRRLDRGRAGSQATCTDFAVQQAQLWQLRLDRLAAYLKGSTT